MLELVKGRDGKTRDAKLKVLYKSGRQTVVFRPIQKLFPFEITEAGESTLADKEELCESDNTIDNDIEDEECVKQRPQRKAEVKGQDRRRLHELYH